MSCRRCDRARLIGCHVGPAAICGIPNETNGGDYERLITQERYTFGPEDSYSGYLFSDGEDLQSCCGRKPCIDPYRHKFVCVDCRRCFKQAIIEGNVYEDDRWGQLRRVGPERERVKEVWDAYYSIVGKSRRHNMDDEAAKDLIEKQNRYWTEGESGFTPEELEELRKISPEFLWKDMKGNGHCPQCGKEGRKVGGTFRPCAQTDDKGWKWIKERLDAGEDFSFCMTHEEQAEVIQEGKRLKERKKGDEAWIAERNRRIAELKAASERGQRTKTEEEKLNRIRGGKELCDSSVV